MQEWPAGADTWAAAQRDARRDHPAVLAVAGDVSPAAARRLEARLLDAVPDGPAPRLIVDLAGLTSLSAAGLDVLLAVQRRVDALGGRMALRSPSAAVILLLHDAVWDDAVWEDGRTPVDGRRGDG
jgi:anti-anti-sigma factor